MRNVYLYGRAAEIWGPKFPIDVADIPEAIRALCCKLQGFAQFLEAHDFHVVRGQSYEGGKEVEEHQVPLGLNETDDIHLYPVATFSGGKMGGIGKLIAGVLLMGFAFWAAPAMGIASLGGISLNQVGMMGIGMAIAGVSMMMSAQEDDKEKESHGFSGVPQMATQGDPVPVWYGHEKIENPPIISAGITARNADI